MCRLREAIRQTCIELWKNQSWILYHDNAPAHTAKNKSVIMSQPTYSPNWLFPPPKTKDERMKGKRFATIEEIKGKSKQELLMILKSAF